MIQPQILQKGDTIGLMCPAGYMLHEKAATCIAALQSWGYHVEIGKTLGSASQNYFSGTDEERKNELQEMLDNKKIKAILFARGGYGTGRIIDDLNFKKFIKHPKWLIGFSDITILSTHLFSNYKIATIHGPMAAAFNNGIDEYILSLKNVLEGKKSSYSCAADNNNKEGNATGTLIGGNLALLTHVIGTPSDFKTNHKILFIEDIGEYLYNVDRMLFQLKRSGKFNNLKGLVFGGFSDMKDTERPYGKSIQQILNEISSDLECPVAFNFPVSHGVENVALKVGGKYRLTVNNEEVTLKEI